MQWFSSPWNDYTAFQIIVCISAGHFKVTNPFFSRHPYREWTALLFMRIDIRWEIEPVTFLSPPCPRINPWATRPPSQLKTTLSGEQCELCPQVALHWRWSISEETMCCKFPAEQSSFFNFLHRIQAFQRNICGGFFYSTPPPPPPTTPHPPSREGEVCHFPASDINEAARWWCEGRWRI